jgi:hypothetical protein
MSPPLFKDTPGNPYGKGVVGPESQTTVGGGGLEAE